ncbi:MAG TPA: histidinol dehydrogenase [Candidatus Limnocylindrales bacterium]|nr:histidinol dehydrogenase [Candidatus Limnocylindrales bacterium]
MTAIVPPAAAARFALRRLELPGRGEAADPATASTLEGLFRRAAVSNPAVRDAARAILDDVRLRGDAAVIEAGATFGGLPSDGRLVIAADELAAAARNLPADVRRALEQAIDNVRTFAVPQRPMSTSVEVSPGVVIDRRWLPLRRVGCYVPGGSAPLPSSLVMTVVPARVAGVEEIVVATPAGPDGGLDSIIAGTAGLLGVDALLVSGGAQAIGALAFGLPDARLDPVDRIVGPGNAWVTAAKLEIASIVGIDLPAGPSEGMVLADASADATLVAADLVTQAEHGPDSPAILVTTDAGLADDVEREIGALLGNVERAAILEQSLRDHAWIVLAPDLASAIRFVDRYAPEHLSIETADPESALDGIRNAGSIFVGPWAPESAGDYATGANHVLPTGGLARSSGPLSVEAFGRFSQVQRVDREGLASIADTVRTLATTEGLTAHRHAVDVRFREPDDGR